MEPGAQFNPSRMFRPPSATTMPLRTMGAIPGKISDIGYFYDKSESVVRFLVEEYGEDQLRRFLVRMNERQLVNEALLGVYGFDQDGLDHKWSGDPVESGAIKHYDDKALVSTGTMIFVGGGLFLATAIIIIIFLRKSVAQSGSNG